MNHRFSSFSSCTVVLLFIFVCFLSWYLLSIGPLEFQLQDARESLKTSQGRENKQQYEYDQVYLEIPVVQEEIALKAPLAEEAEARVSELKRKKKELKAEIKELSSPDASSEAAGHE